MVKKKSIKKIQKDLENFQKAREKLIIDEWKRNPLSDKEINESFKEFVGSLPGQIAKNPAFFNVMITELDKTIVKEEDTKKTILLVALGGKLTENCEPTSKNLMVNDESGAGKDYIVKQILKLLPEDEVIIKKRISEKVFTYWHNAKFEPDWNWNSKIFYNEDINNSLLNSDVFKVMSSSDGENSSTIMYNQTPIEVITKGKPVMIITIAMANPKQELLRRFPICNLDTTEDQTKLILKRKAEFHEKGIKPRYNDNIKKAILGLKRVKVKVPFASKLVNVLSTKHIIIRTHFDRFIDYIAFSAAIHQFQREKDTEGFILATEKDYERGREALIKTTSNIFSVPLTKNQQKIIAILKELGADVWSSVTDLEPKITFCSDRQLRRDLDKLTNFGFLAKDKQERAEGRKPVMVYSYLDHASINIPIWKELQNLSSVTIKSSKSSMSSMSKGGVIDKHDILDKQARRTEMPKISEEVVK